MNSQVRQCQNCKNQFVIEPDDLVFYGKIRVPPPTWCPKCRRQRRLAFRNERALYKNKCFLCGKDLISMYAQDSPYTVACFECWWSDTWDPMRYGREYDFSKPFFEQYCELMKSVPRPPFMQRNTKDSPYSNSAVESRNIYLSYSIVECEYVYYTKAADKSRYLFDCLHTTNSERCYENVFSDHNYNSVGCLFSEGCIDSWFLYDCAGCQNCILSANLRKRQYVIRSRQYSREEYFEELKKLNFSSWENYASARQELVRLMRSQAVHKYANAIRTVDSWGDNIMNTKNVRDAFDLYDLENSKHGVRLFRSKDSMDADYTFGAELVYEYVNGGRQLFQVKFSVYALENLKYANYTDTCSSSSDLFGCIGLRGKQHCILNRQYSKNEYERMIPKIIEHMKAMPYIDARGREYRYGEFFPPDLSPFTYNETVAQEHFPLTEKGALQGGWRWRSPEVRSYRVSLGTEDIPDSISDATDDVLNEIVACAHDGQCNEQCTNAFRVIQEELQFYRRIGLPLPRLCPNCRHYQRLKLRNPLKLWHRQCMCDRLNHGHAGKCPNEFETSYAPDRPEVVYCGRCYNAEVA